MRFYQLSHCCVFLQSNTSSSNICSTLIKRIWTSSHRVAICICLSTCETYLGKSYFTCSLFSALFTRFYFSAHAVINFPFNVECGTCPSFIYAFKQKKKREPKCEKKTTLVGYSIYQSRLRSFTQLSSTISASCCHSTLLFRFPSFLTLIITNFCLGKNSFLNIFIDFLYYAAIKFPKRV